MTRLTITGVCICMAVSLGLSAWQGADMMRGSKGPEKPKKKDNRPNIVVILADDLGFSDIGCYGGEIKTPNLDYLAANGLRFSRFYNTSRCCPTRASLMTGLYNHQAGVGWMTEAEDAPGYRGHIGDNTVTLAEVLKAAGYHTGMSGKWHISNTIEQPTKEAQLAWLQHEAQHPYFSPVEQYPVNRGFEKYFGNLWGVVDYFDPFALVSGTTPVTNIPKGYYHTNAINDTAVSYIKEFAKDDAPFFLYVAETAPHWPLMALPEDIEKYKDVYKAGWDRIREERYKRLIQLGLIDSSRCHLSPRQNAAGSWEANPHKEWDARAMAVHAAMVDCMDQGIGRIVRALKETGKLDNTLIVFLSDNGASPENAMAYGPGFDRPGKTRDGQTIHYPVQKDTAAMPGPETTFSSLGEVWANVANTPFRYAKAQSYEGGLHTPMIAFWPRGISARGHITLHIGHVMDFMSTFVELAKTTYPATYKGKNIMPTEGISLLPVLKGSEKHNHQTLFNEHFRARYVREGEWKLVSLSSDTTWHLYRINEDQSELNDLAGRYPEVVRELADKWQVWARTHNVYPKPKR